MSQPSPVPSTKRVITIETRERRGSDPITGSKRKDSQRVFYTIIMITRREGFTSILSLFLLFFSPFSCRLAIVTLATIAKNVILSVKDSCRICGGKFVEERKGAGGSRRVEGGGGGALK